MFYLSSPTVSDDPEVQTPVGTLSQILSTIIHRLSTSNIVLSRLVDWSRSMHSVWMRTCHAISEHVSVESGTSLYQRRFRSQRTGRSIDRHASFWQARETRICNRWDHLPAFTSEKILRCDIRKKSFTIGLEVWQGTLMSTRRTLMSLGCGHSSMVALRLEVG